jgi:hypothetical protein
MKNLPVQFEGTNVRRVYDEKSETWFFSVVDIVQILTQQPNSVAASNYWRVLKHRLKKEGSQVVTSCNRVRLKTSGGKSYMADIADVETILRLVQSIPSPKAEPIKLWLAKTGYERMQEAADPSRAFDRARETWQKLGRSEKWIQQRVLGQQTRNKLTDYWATHEIKKGGEYAILTNIIHESWAGLGVAQHKKLKGLKSQNLRDHMSEAELIFTALAELSTRQIAEKTNATGMPENKMAARSGGSIARSARIELEGKTGQGVITGQNYSRLTKR